MWVPIISKYRADTWDSMRALICGDWHAPFYDPSAFRALIALIKERRPNQIILNGDIIDFYPVSTHLRSPRRALTLQEELDSARALLEVLRESAPNARIFYLYGNHEERFVKYLWRASPELLSLRSLSLSALLGLEPLRIERTASYAFMPCPELVVLHGRISRKRSGYTAHAHMEQFGYLNGVNSHTHRLAKVYRRLPTGQTLIWTEAGCVCQLSPCFDPYPDWQHGCVWAEWDKDGKLQELEAVPLKGRSRSRLALPAPASPAWLDGYDQPIHQLEATYDNRP